MLLLPSMLTESWVEGKSVEEKDAQPTERTAALWGLSSKIDSRIWVNFKRNGLRLGSRHQEPPHILRLTWTKKKKNWTVAQWSKVLFSDESKFCFSFGESRVWMKGWEAHRSSCLKSSVKFPQSVMIWVAMSSAGVGPFFFFWKPTSLHPFTNTFWRTSCFLLLTSFLKMLISFSSRIWHLPTLPKAPKAG